MTKLFLFLGSLMLIANKYKIPDTCPDDCPECKKLAFDQGCLCSRCPIFNCGKSKDGFYLIKPENYRETWALEWYNWFQNGMQGYPELKF